MRNQRKARILINSKHKSTKSSKTTMLREFLFLLDLIKLPNCCWQSLFRHMIKLSWIGHLGHFTIAIQLLEQPKSNNKKMSKANRKEKGSLMEPTSKRLVWHAQTGLGFMQVMLVIGEAGLLWANTAECTCALSHRPSKQLMIRIL